MDKLLIFPKLEEEKEFHYFPFSLLKIASKLVAEGHKVEILDQRVEKHFFEKLESRVKKGNVDIGISSFSGYQITQAYSIAKFIKDINPNITITLGGAFANENSHLKCNLIDEFSVGYVEDFPIKWHLVDIEKYINPATKRFIYISSYGCPGVCSFCATPHTRKLVFPSMDLVELDIDNLMEIYPFKECWLADASIWTYETRALKLSQIMQKHDLNYIADARADQVIRTSQTTLDSIMSSGLHTLTVGLETGSERISKLYKKGKNHLEKYMACAKLLSKYDIKLTSGVIFGAPGETVEDLKETIEYIKKVKAINPNFFISTTFFMPLPNTKLAQECEKYGYKPPNTFEDYVREGAGMHFTYNEYMANKWIDNPVEYKKIYDDFIEENKEILI